MLFHNLVVNLELLINFGGHVMSLSNLAITCSSVNQSGQVHAVPLINLGSTCSAVNQSGQVHVVPLINLGKYI